MYDANVNVNSVIEDVTQIKIGITVTVDLSGKIKKTSCARNRLFSWSLATCSCENGKYVRSNIFDSVISPNEIIDETKTVSTNFNKKGKL